MTNSAWRLWCCFCSFASSGHGCQGKVCCCKVKSGRPTAIPDSHDFWKDNDRCDCNLICCGLQSRTNTAPIATTTVPAGQAYTAPQAQHIPPATHGPPPTGAASQPTFVDPVKPTNTGYPTVQ